jgi:hypothetical protein
VALGIALLNRIFDKNHGPTDLPDTKALRAATAGRRQKALSQSMGCRQRPLSNTAEDKKRTGSSAF